MRYQCPASTDVPFLQSRIERLALLPLEDLQAP